jgi:hypothetical protein
MKSVCQAANFDVFWDSTTGSNRRAYSCLLAKKTGNYAVGTPIVLYKRDNGGSAYGVNNLVNGAGNTPTPTFNMAAISATSNTAPYGTCTLIGPSPTSDITVPGYTCAGTQLVNPDAGISDEEPAVFTKLLDGLALNLPTTAVSNGCPTAAGTNNGNPNFLNKDDNGACWAPLTPTQSSALDSAVFNQTILGLAVSTPTYRALQASQDLTQDDAEADRPTVPRAFYTGAAAGYLSGSSTSKPGWGSIISSSVDSAVATKQVNICRRGAGSGTQAASNLFFLDAGLLVTSAAGAYLPAGQQGSSTSTVTGTFAVNEASSTGNVILCLGNATSAGAYAIGVLSLENGTVVNGVDQGFRFVKIDGASPLRSNAQIGAYPFVYSATMQYLKTGLDVNKKSFLLAMRTNAGSPANLAQNDPITANGEMSSPASFQGLCSAQTDPNVIAFGSCVERREAKSPWDGTYLTNSLAPLKLVK